MNRLVWMVVSVLSVGLTGLALAQDSNNAPGGGTTAAAPADNSPSTGAAAASGIPKFPGRVIGMRIKRQYERIKEGVKSQKLTEDEAKDLRAKVDAVRDQLKADFEQNKQNGVKKITDDQYTQLKQLLDENSKAIHDDKNDGETDANAGSSATAPSAAPAGDSSAASMSTMPMGNSSSSGSATAPAGDSSSTGAAAPASTAPSAASTNQ